MPEQILQIDPEHELKFRGPFNIPSTSMLKLTNPSDKRVCFKIKTTAPKRYCVRPNAGMLQPGTSATIAVVFQPCELEPTATKHKFMVQSLYCPDGEFDMDSLWKDVDNTKLMDTKLRCSFEGPSDAPNQNDLNSSETVKTSRSKGDDTFSKSQKDTNDLSAESTMEAQSPSETESFLPSVSDEGPTGDASARLSAAQEAAQLRQENGQLKDEIDRLRRQMKSREASGYAGSGMQSANPPATPMLHIIMALVVLLVGLILGKFFV